MKSIALLGSLLLLAGRTALFAQTTPISGPLDYKPQPFDVIHYDVALDLTAAPKTTTHGVCTIGLRWIGSPADGFRFHLRDLTIDSIFYDGAPVTVTTVGTPDSATYHYEMPIPPSVHTGDSGTVRVVYHGTMTREPGPGMQWGGVQSLSNILFAMGVGFSNNYVSATQHWLPCYDHPSDKATFHGRFFVKKGMNVASNGLGTIEHFNDTTDLYDWRHDIPCATYLYTFAVAPFVRLDIASAPVPMMVYALPADTTATRRSFKQLDRMVAMLSRRFLPYPFEKVGYVNTPIGSMEHETMISFDVRLSRSGDTVNATAAHELAHQWFGDLVTPRDFRDAWLNEGFATFCETLWAEELGGNAPYLSSQTTKLNSYLTTDSKAEGVLPLYNFPRATPSSNYPSTIYDKGAVVLGMLRYELGDSIFFQGIQDYLRRYSYGNTTTDSLRAVLESHAGRSLGWFFDQWVLRAGWPVIRVDIQRADNGNGTDRVEARLTQALNDTMIPYQNLPVELGFVSGTTTTYRMLKLSAGQQTFVLDSIPHFTTVNVNQGPSVRALLKVSAVAGVAVSPKDSSGVSITVRPNPAASSMPFTVEVNGTKDCSDMQYELFDTNGQRQLEGRNSSCTFTIPTAGIASGAYVLRFHHNGVLYDVPVAIEH